MDGVCYHGFGLSRSISPTFPFCVSLDLRVLEAQVRARGRGASPTSLRSNVSREAVSILSASYHLLRPFHNVLPSFSNQHHEICSKETRVFEQEKHDEKETREPGELSPMDQQHGSWLLKILRAGFILSESGHEQVTLARDDREEEEEGKSDQTACKSRCACGNEEEIGRFRATGDEELQRFDRNSFCRMLRRVSLADARLYAKMSYLGTLAYTINKIKAGNLLKYHGLGFVTSSLEKRNHQLKTRSERNINSSDNEGNVNHSPTLDIENEIVDFLDTKESKKIDLGMCVTSGYRIAAATVSYVQSQTASFLPFKMSKMNMVKGSVKVSSINNSEEIGETSRTKAKSFATTTDSVTAAVAANEEMKQAVVKDLSSAHSSPCEWFICDDNSSGTRFFVIQGSESLASWQANLLFEPIQFEGYNVLVHRGIYEAAKGLYEQMLPEVQAHLKSWGVFATIRFTGHSLGGSLALLVNLLLFIRGDAPQSALLPVVTFGSPSIMCGGDHLLLSLGLPLSHVQAVIMHRDIVPRAFSCSYPDHVAELLMALNESFRNHPCFKNEKVLYAPMGELLILQPEAKFSPHHPLLPSGSGLYLLRGSPSSHLQAAKAMFLNSPHPLEILSDPSAYGSRGSIFRDHDMVCYLKSVVGIIRHEINSNRKGVRGHRKNLQWSLIVFHSICGEIISRLCFTSACVGQWLGFTVSFISKSGKSLGQFRVLVSLSCCNMQALLLHPVQLLGRVLTVIT